MICSVASSRFRIVKELVVKEVDFIITGYAEVVEGAKVEIYTL